MFAFSPPDNETFEASAPSAPAPSPDGRQIAFLTRAAAGERVVWVRELNSSTAHRVAGTEGAVGAPFWSPAGRFIGFVADGRLKKIDPSGGPALNICAAMGNLGASWSRDNVIVFAPSNRSPLFRVSATGGTPEPMFELNTARRENSHRHPSFLPDSRHFLFTARSDVKENNLIYVGSLDSPDLQSVIAAQSNAVYSPPGYLLFAQDGTVMAQPFDAGTLSLSGEAVPVAARVRHTTPSSHAGFGVSLDGTVLTFHSQSTVGRRLAWFDRSGKHLEWVGPDREFNTEVRLAPNGKLAGVVLPDPVSGNRDIWLLDLATGNLTRFTSHPANDWQLVWAPDGQEIAFASDRSGHSSVFRKRIDGGDERLVVQIPDRAVFSRDWSADGRFLTLNVDPPTEAMEIWVVPLFGEGKPFPLNQAPAAESEAMVSPDGEGVAYESTESGSVEVYVKPFARPGKRRISTAGGRSPRWRRDGRELFYRAQNGDLMSVSLTSAATLDVSASRRLFTGCDNVPYDVNADGSRFLMICAAPDASPSPISVFVDWTAALQR